MHWARAARTDKGVSAVGNVVSLQLVLDKRPNLLQHVNDALPPQVRAALQLAVHLQPASAAIIPGGSQCMPLHRASALHQHVSCSLPVHFTRCTCNATWASVLQVRVLGWERVTKNFDARTQCDRRRYEYLLPASAFRPEPPAAKAARGGLADGEAGAAAAACAGVARGPAVAVGAPASGAPGVPAGGPGAQAAAPGSGPPGAPHAGQVAPVLSNGGVCAPSSDAAQAGSGADAGAALLGGQPAGPAPPPAAAPAGASAGAGPGLGIGFTEGAEQGAAEAPLDAAERARVDGVLATYLGTHNFHNFTVRMAAGDPSANRYILSFRVGGALALQARPAPALS